MTVSPCGKLPEQDTGITAHYNFRSSIFNGAIDGVLSHVYPETPCLQSTTVRLARRKGSNVSQLAVEDDDMMSSTFLFYLLKSKD